MTIRLLLPPSVGRARALARAELLDQSLQADLAQAVEVDVAEDYSDLARRAQTQKAHLIWLPPRICAQLEPELRGLYKCIRHGRGTYRSALVARRGELRGLLSVQGCRAAWVDRLSVGGYLLARAELTNAGLSSDDLAEEQFVGNYPDALRAVMSGRADVAAIMVRDDSAVAVREAIAMYGGKPAVDALAPLAVTPESPNDAIGLTNALDRRAARQLALRVFEREGSRARAAFCLAFEAEGFVEAKPQEYAALRELLAL